MTDPSEAADVRNMLPALNATFPEGRMTWLGGSIYCVGLSDIIWCFAEHAAYSELRLCLAMDEMLSVAGENLYGLFISRG